MKMKKNLYNMLGLGIVSALTLTACSDTFLEDKKNYDNVTPEIYNYYSGANGRVSDVYGWCLPDPKASANWKYNSTGWNDDQAKSTEEYSGFGAFVDPQNPLTALSGTMVPDYFMGDPTNIQASVYGRIRNINDVIAGISGSTLPESDKNKLLGQVYFFRAWCYYQLVKWYGGVPIVTELLDPVESSFTPRSSAKDCFEFILKDLDMSAQMLEDATLNGGWASTDDWGRITTGTALALKGRVLLLWASPLFNRTGDQKRWDDAYETMKNDLGKIQSCGYGLYSQSNDVNGSAFASMFTQIKSSEAVFCTLRSTQSSGDEYNTWEESIRPKNATGVGRFTPSSMIIDMFPMKDGKRPASCNTYTKLETSAIAYNSEYPFMDRDPRFYRTFVFPGMRWAYSGDPTQKDPNNPSYNAGKDYELWSYVWYTDLDEAGDVDKGNSYAADNLLTNRNSVYIRKRSDDADINPSPLYVWDATNNQSAFRYSAAPYIEIRYAEVLLNLAEAACMAGNTTEAIGYIRDIRKRAGYTGDCGIQDNLDKPACMSAILYERQIEFAYEGKRFDDLRRWMLFDGGANMTSVNGAPSTWKLEGFGGNTCTWLGMKPLNGQRRDGIEYRTNDKYGVGGVTYDKDPLLLNNVERCAAVDLRQELDGQLNDLKAWYENNLTFKVKKGDARLSSAGGNTDLYMEFLPRYYFLGLTQGAMDKNKGLQQTIGWENTNEGGANGTFDPLAE